MKTPPGDKSLSGPYRGHAVSPASDISEDEDQIEQETPDAPTGDGEAALDLDKMSLEPRTQPQSPSPSSVAERMFSLERRNALLSQGPIKLRPAEKRIFGKDGHVDKRARLEGEYENSDKGRE